MAVSNVTPVISYTADGVITDFAYPFRILDASHIHAYFDGVEQATGFTVTGVGNDAGGTVSFTTPPAANVVVKLQRMVPTERTQDYVNGGRMNADIFDYDFDALVMMAQDEHQWAIDTLAYYTTVAGDAAASAAAAATSEANAATSETNAANSATAAATSATNAATSETNAANSATAAANSAAAAAASEANAAVSETNAATSATNAATSETNAASSEAYCAGVEAAITLNATYSETFVGDGVTTNFTLSHSIPTVRAFVSINGVVQSPTTAYSIAGTTLTFTEAPLATDTIEVREMVGGVSVSDAHTHWQYARLDASSAPNVDAAYDLGSATNRFNNMHSVTFEGTSTSAQYADLAEFFIADQDYEPGTVVGLGGSAEVTANITDMSTAQIGVVSTNPAFLMNANLQDETHAVAVAYSGRVPCKVIGPVQAGDMLVSAGNGFARAEANPRIGSVIGKAMQTYNGNEGIIEIVVGRY